LKTLYPVQERHVDLLLNAIRKHNAALDASDTGTGKTLCAVETARRLGKSVFVVCPKIVVPSWERTIKEQGVASLGVINYEKLRTGRTRYGHWAGKNFEFKLPQDAVIVWDEVHRCQGMWSKNAKMLIAAKSWTNLLLSASASEDPTEMRASGFILGLHVLTNFFHWAKAHGCRVNPWGALEFSQRENWALDKINAELYPEHGDRMTRGMLAEHFQETRIVTDPLDFGDKGAIQKLYDEMDQELSALEQKMRGDSKNKAAEKLVAQLRARQAVELAKVPATVELIEDELHAGNSVAVFVNFEATIEAVGQRLKVPYEVIKGGQSSEERESVVQQFSNDDVHVVLCNIAAGGLGVSLHDQRGVRPRTAFISPTYNAKDMLQTLGRVDRAGAKSKSVQRILFAAGTIEEKVEASVKSKLKNISTLHDTGLTSQPDSITLQQHMTHTNPVADMGDKHPQAVTGAQSHAEHGPSSLKYKEICPSWRNRDSDNWASQKGDRIHAAMETDEPSHCANDEERAMYESLQGFVVSIVKQRAEEKRRVAEDHRELRVDIDLGCERSTFGTCDRFLIYSDNTADAIDYKTGYGEIDDAEINIQGQAYVLGMFQKFPRVTEITMWFLVPARDEVSMHTYKREDMPVIRLRVSTIIERAEKGGAFNPQPGVCDYCATQAQCPALANKALLIAQRYDRDGLAIPESVHGSEQNDPDAVAKLLTLVPIIESWAAGVRKRATEMAVEQGVELPGFKVIETKRARSITSGLGAWEAVKEAVDLRDFMTCVDKVSYPRLEELFASKAAKGTKAKTRQALEGKLRDLGVLQDEGVGYQLRKKK
jgi:RecB family exonuclease